MKNNGDVALLVHVERVYSIIVDRHGEHEDRVRQLLSAMQRYYSGDETAAASVRALYAEAFFLKTENSLGFTVHSELMIAQAAIVSLAAVFPQLQSTTLEGCLRRLLNAAGEPRDAAESQARLIRDGGALCYSST